jgi:malonyl-CoA/methylmalonyl-CoA synthetase
VFFTSGTTGVPKAARLSHDQLAHLAELVGRHWEVDADDCLIHCLPLHHMHGLGIAFLVCALAGARLKLLGAFDVERVWDALAAGTIFMAVPTMHKRLLEAFQRVDGPQQRRWAQGARRLRLVTSGSAPLPEQLAFGWKELTGQIPLERFGMTEVGVALSNPLHGERRVGSCGRALPGMEVRIVDEAGFDVAPGLPGEIWIRGPSVFLGYDDAVATEGCFCEGWFKSGDTATWLDDGFVKILGRTSVDIIKSGGEKLSALEIEEELRRQDGIDDAAVVGLVDSTWGERVVAAVVGAAALDEAALSSKLKLVLAPHKVPKRFVQLRALPTNLLGKVDKHRVREILQQRLHGDRRVPARSNPPET